jgi:UDP-glucose 4-epimerase
MSKIIVTGGAGFIGSHLTDKLIEKGHTVVVVDNFSTGKYQNLEDAQKTGQLQTVKIDISTPVASSDLVEIIKDAEYVFHLAALPSVPYSVEYPGRTHDVNVTGTFNLLNAIRIATIGGYLPNFKKFVMSSSCFLYGNQEVLPIPETAEISITTPYAAHKHIDEVYIKMFNTLYGVPAVILRYFNVYGSRRQSESGSYPNLLAAFSKSKRDNNLLKITGDGSQSRDMVHIDDVVHANIMVAESDINTADVFNVGSGAGTSVNSVAKYFDCPIEYTEARKGEIQSLISDNRKIRETFNWTPQIQFDEGIKRYLS